MNLFKDKVVLITGASHGLGRKLAFEFGKEKASVVINYFQSKKEAEEVKDKLKNDYQIEAIVVRADVSKRGDVEKMLEKILNKFNSIDILINNAGIVLDPASWKEINEINWERTLAVNLKGVFECCRAVGQVMLKQKFGKIINISSLRGILGGAEVIAYAAAKAGVDNLTKSFAKALAPDVNVNGLSLRTINIGMGKLIKKNEIEPLTQKTLSKRIGEIDDVINGVFFLASDKSNYITGQTLVIDGGITLK